MAKSESQSVLAVHPGALGDVVLFGHLLAGLAGHVTLATGGEKGRLLASAGVVAEAVEFESLPMHEVFADTPLDDCRLPELLGHHGRVISCFAQGDKRAEQRLAALCGATQWVFLPTRPPEDYVGHLLQLWLEWVEDRWGKGAVQWDLGRILPWRCRPQWRQEAAGVLGAQGVDAARPYAVVHPGAGSQAKCWPLERYIDLAKALAGEGLAAVFVIGPVECDRWVDGRIEGLRRRLPLLVCPSLEPLAGALAGATCYVGNDSGMSHLAAALGCRTLALFGATRSDHFRPLGPRVRIVEADRIEDIQVRQVLHKLYDWAVV